MKWRDRISILSRKRNRRNVVAQPNGATGSSLPSGSGVPREAGPASTSASRESVQSTLSQLRPVIGPDHKSYYILLRGNGDLFTCIQPAKNVIHSLDDMMKNVMNSVKSAKVPEVSAHSKRPRHNQTKTYSTSALHKQSVGSRKNGVGGGALQAVLLGEGGGTQVTGVHLEDVFVTREGNSGANSVVQNAVPNRTLSQVSNELPRLQQARTNTLMHHPTVQSRLASKTSTNNNIVKQDSSSLLLSQGCNEEGSQSSVLVPSQELLPATLSAPTQKREMSCQTKMANGHEGHMGQTILNQAVKTDGLENNFSSVLASVGQNTLQELRLISKEGTVLTEQEIAAQIKTLIENEQLIIGEDTQIIVLRVSEREVIVKLVLSEVQVRPVVSEVQIRPVVSQSQQHQQQQQMTQSSSPKDFINEHFVKQEPTTTGVKEEVTISPCLSPAHEEDGFTQDVLVSWPHQDSDLDCFFASYTQGKQAFEGMRGISLGPGLGVLESLAEPLVDPEVIITQQQQQEELDKLPCAVGDLEDLGQSLLQGAGEIVVFQQEDGTLVNQNGIPISSELQYLIASSQQDLETSLGPESQNNQCLRKPLKTIQ